MSMPAHFSRTPLFPKFALSLLLAPLGLAAWGSAQAATTYYVRTDGGDASQCTGRADAPYPGSGTGQACAWKHPFYALAPGGGKRIAGGDTLLIGSGSYMMGQGAPGAGSCSAGSCYMAAIPSGTASAPTRILGKGKVTLWGTKGTKTVLNLDGSSHVEVGNLEVTDHDDCVYQHSNATANCASGGGWARDGLRASASRNVWLHDLDIHGLAAAGMYAGGLTDWTLDRVKVNYNGRVGWNANIGSGSSSAGQIVMRDIEIAWNGCGQRWQTGEPWACWAQQTGGYGDGLGTTTTGGKWLVEDAFVHHNTSDGLDFRYMDGASGTSVTLRRVYSVANAGNQVKVKGNSLIENSVLVSQCGYFDGRYFMTSGDQCRAGGNTVQLVFTSNNTAVVRHNTITGEGGVLIGAIEGDGSNKVLVQNNVIVGFPTFLDPGKLSSVYYANSTGVVDSWAGNLVWNVKNNTCPSGSICGKNPRLKDMRLASFDAEPLQDSPAIDKVPVISSVNSDFVMEPRPAGATSDIGAYEWQVASTDPTPTPSPDPTPTCTRAAPTMSVSGDTSALAAGTTNSYTVTARNNDSSGCSNTTLQVARTAPSGWTSALSVTSITLSPGASANIGLAVTSPSNAAAGTYGIGTAVSSSVGSVHTANASTTYTVATPAPSAANLTESVGTDKGSYARGDTVHISARVLSNGNPVSGATVAFTVQVPKGPDEVQQAVTGQDGYARMTLALSKGKSAEGTYALRADATLGSAGTNAKGGFVVQ